jgi:pimeloyl-ACP methyl ester carboxylesterase
MISFPRISFHRTMLAQVLPTGFAAVTLLPAVAAFADTKPPSEAESIATPVIAEAIATAPVAADEAAKECLTGGCRNWLRTRIIRDVDLSCYGIVLDENWREADAEKPVVLVLHGYNSCPLRNQAMADAIRGAGYPTGTFAYPNDYTIVASAQLLSSELRRLHREHPDRRIVLVCHSMGGMVARACVENSLYDPGNIDRVILIAPPSSGTAIAHFAIGTDLYEHWLSRTSGGPWRRVRDSIVDGLGEAADELCPGSPFLEEMNSRSRNPRVAYSVILGTGASMTEAEMEWIRESVLQKLAKVPGAEGGIARLETLLGDMDELIEGKGDGVVSVSRGRLDGVSDTLVLPFGHISVTGEPATDVVREVQAEVLKRLN